MKYERFLIVILMFSFVFLCGCDRTQPRVLFNKQPINEKTIQASTNLFEAEDTIHYVLLMPNGFKSPYLRMQIIKKNTKTQNWGFDVYRGENIKVDDSKKFYIDKIKLSQPGFYIVSFYYLSDLVHPITRATFTVK